MEKVSSLGSINVLKFWWCYRKDQNVLTNMIPLGSFGAMSPLLFPVDTHAILSQICLLNRE